MQPLDVVVFEPYKHYPSEAVDTVTRTGCSDFNKTEFLHTISLIQNQTFRETTIGSAF